MCCERELYENEHICPTCPYGQASTGSKAADLNHDQKKLSLWGFFCNNIIEKSMDSVMQMFL